MKRALLVLCQGVEEYEASVFTDALGWTTTYGLEPIALVTVGLRPKVRCAWNFTIEPQYQLEQIDVTAFDALLIPGGMGRAGFYEDAYDGRLLALIRQFDAAHKLIASVCVGAMPLAQSGVLQGRRGTTYCHSPERQQQMAALGVQVQAEPLVVDDNIITCSSPGQALQVAFMVVERLSSAANLARIQEGMGFSPTASG